MIQSLIPGYRGPEQWRPLKSHGTFYSEHAYLSDRCRVLNYREGKWKLVRPRTSRSRRNEGANLYYLTGPDGVSRGHYFETLMRYTFTMQSDDYRRRSPLLARQY